MMMPIIENRLSVWCAIARPKSAPMIASGTENITMNGIKNEPYRTTIRA